MNVVVIDDEVDARATLINFLNKKCPDVKVVGQGHSVQSGIEAILTTQPDVVFLDIKMGDGTGFDLLEQIDLKHTGVVFTTAYDAFAIQAIKKSAWDYLLKPIDSEELLDAVNRIKRRMNMGTLNSVVPTMAKSGVRIPVSFGNRTHILYSDEITFIESDAGYCNLHKVDGTVATSSKAIGEFEALLASEDFFRIHQSYLINCKMIDHIRKKEGELIVIGGRVLEISRRKKTEFLEYLF